MQLSTVLKMVSKLKFAKYIQTLFGTIDSTKDVLNWKQSTPHAEEICTITSFQTEIAIVAKESFVRNHL